MTGWLLNLAYAILLIAISPLVLWRMIFRGKYRNGWSQKILGSLPRLEGSHPCLWIHAVSVGEVLQIRPVVAALREKHADYQFVISTTTVTGYEVARKSFPDDTICYFPLDFTWAVRRALRRLQPAALVLVELELWPNLLRAAHRQGVPILLINGRLSEKSFRGYRRLRFLMRGILHKFHILAVQNEIYAKRMQELGVPADRLIVTGSIKFDAIVTDRENPRTTEIRRSFGVVDDELVFIAGSTQAPEEDYALSTYHRLRAEFPRLRLVLAPRHKERFEEVARLVEERGFPLIRRSHIAADHGLNDLSGKRPVLLLDTLGELSACWGLADIAFVGGSLTNRGGQNMIEPAGYGAAMLFGPNTRNFRDVVEILLKENAARVVYGPEDLTNRVREFLQTPLARRQLGQRAQQLVLSQQGATARTLELITEVLTKAGEPLQHQITNAA